MRMCVCVCWDHLGCLVSCDSVVIGRSLRLVSSTSTNAGAGRLEVFLRREWGTVCGDGFGITEANVACRQLGYPSAATFGNVRQLG